MKILILRFSSIGDIVLTTPVIRGIKKQLPGVELHYLTKPSYKSILEFNPYIDKLHVLDKPLLDKALELKQHGFDYIIDLHNNIRTRIIKSVIDTTAFTFDKLNAEKWALVRLKVDTLPELHIVDRYMATVANLGVVNDDEGLDYFLPDSVHESLAGSGLPEKYIAFAIGAQHYTKKLPAEKIIGICRLLRFPVVLLGGKEDEDTGTAIAAAAGPNVLNLCGKLSLHESAFVIRESVKVVTHDTGLMHIAAAFHKEIVSVWGNTVPQFGMTPYYGNIPSTSHVAEVKGLYCRPCSRIGYTRCPLGHFNCMKLQDEDGIARAVQAGL